jgi:hypothetical protein
MVADAVTRAESVLAAAEPADRVALVVGDGRVSLPVPGDVTAETGRDRLRPGSEVALRLRWFPSEADERDS